MAKMKTQEKYISELDALNPNIKVIGQYAGGHIPILHKCNIDEYEWKASPSSILYGRGCPECAKTNRIVSLTKTHEQYVDELKKIFPQVSILEKYINRKTKILHQCNICGYIWCVKPDQLLSGKGCPVCIGRTVGPAPEYKNSIWASEYKDFFSKYLTQDQMKQLTPHSGKKINVICPDCGRVKQIRVSDMCRKGFSCTCQDGQSYPNKFVFNVLSQLNLKITTEYSPWWANDRRYDDYIDEYNIIVENHGLQHYENCCFTTRTLKEEQENDTYKYNLAMANGINAYIVLDCRYSDINWIKKSIMDSSLPKIFNFNECDINWIEAAEYASSNLVKYAANLFNSGYTINQISEIVLKDSTSIRNWLKEATKIGWCNYIPYDRREAVYCIELGVKFDSIKSAHENTGISTGGISRCCQGKQEFAITYKNPSNKTHWLYINDAIKLGYINC